MSYGSDVLKALIEEVKKMTPEEYSKLYEESLKLDDVKIVLPQVNRERSKDRTEAAVRLSNAPIRLRLIADWFDRVYPEMGGKHIDDTEVQCSLRQWADDIALLIPSGVCPNFTQQGSSECTAQTSACPVCDGYGHVNIFFSGVSNE
jgi:hypothetical protein